MKKILYISIIALLTASCSKYPDPSVELLTGYTFTQINSNQKGWKGEFLKDSIVLRLFNQTGTTNGMRVEFKVLTGGGTVTQPTVNVNTTGLAYTKWKTGTQSNYQTVAASVYGVSGELLRTINFNAYTFGINAWDSLNLYPEYAIADIVADTIHNQTYKVSDYNIYKQAKEYFNWNLLSNPLSNHINQIEIDNNGNLFLLNYNREIYTSKDQGASWQYCSKPFADPNTYLYFYISNNGWLWISSGKKLLCSKDKGITWVDASTGLNDGDALGQIFKHPDGTFFFRTSYNRFLSSSDDGKTWTQVPFNNGSINSLYINAKGEIIVYFMADGKHRISRSTDMAASFKELYSVTTNSASSNLNFINNYKDTYYFLIPGKGIVRTKDLTNFEDYYNKTLYNLFIDHSGTVIAIGYNCIYYHKNL